MLTAHVKKADEFIPARPSSLVAACAGALLPLGLRQRLVAQVEIAEEDVARLQALRHERVVLTPNHPTNTDPALLFALSRRAGMPFHYLCCREAFDGWHGWWGYFIQRLGAYSVVRGTIDRDSFRYSRQVIARPASKLVIFPEGEVYSQNDSLLPFQTGAIQLAAWGQEEARKTEPGAQVFLLPIALRYRFAGDVQEELLRKLSLLESKLKLKTHPGATPYTRMRRIAIEVLAAVEHEYALPSPSTPLASDDLTPRFRAAKEAALERAVQLLEMSEMPRGTVPERMRALLYRAEQELHSPPGEDVPATVARQHHQRIQLAWRNLERLANWIAVYDGYAAKNPTNERIAEVIYRLEKDVLGQATYAGPRIATVKVGQPLPLPEKLSRRNLPEWTMELENAVKGML